MAKRGRKLRPCPNVDELRQLVERKELAANITRHFGVGYKTLLKWIEKYGLPPPYRTPKKAPKWGRKRGSIYPSQGKAWQSMNTPEKLATVLTPARIRSFWEKVEKRSPAECWSWTGSISKARGYGSFGLYPFNVAAHRVAWMIHNGVAPADMHVLHTCDHPWCVNPAHLWLGTNTDNYKDRDRKERMPHGVRCAAAKLTEADVRYIRSSSESATVLSKRYGVHYTTVRSARNGKKWRHLN